MSFVEYYCDNIFYPIPIKEYYTITIQNLIFIDTQFNYSPCLYLFIIYYWFYGLESFEYKAYNVIDKLQETETYIFWLQ